VIVHDCVSIADNTVVPPDTVIPAFTIFAGNIGSYLAMALFCLTPHFFFFTNKGAFFFERTIGRPVGTLPDCTPDLMENFITTYYAKFVPQMKA
jgi:hypothetical protein